MRHTSLPYHPELRKPSWSVVKIGWSILLLITLAFVIGLLLIDYKKRISNDDARFNLVYIAKASKNLSVISLDPVEHKTTAITYPPDLKIDSRSVGDYTIAELYTLGSYQEQGGEFARRKVQGFMRLPIGGYIVSDASYENDDLYSKLRKDLRRCILWSGNVETNLSKTDCWYLSQLLLSSSESIVNEETLVREGIIKIKNGQKGYEPERLFSYIGKSLFDWSLGREGAKIAIINMSGIDGLGTDMAGFLSHMGLDVVSVKSGSEGRDQSMMRVANLEKIKLTRELLKNVFFVKEEKGETDEYRADIVLFVGRDMLEMF